MEIPTPPPPTTIVAAAATVKTPDPDSETPQSNNFTKQLTPPLTNGVLKRHKPFHHLQPPPVVVTYKECLKNHAAAMGGHAIDGCGEFMPSPTSSPSYPTSLKCAACGCHRNFHRREPDESLFPSPNNPPIQHVIEYQPHHRHHPPPPQPIPPPAGGANSSSPGNSPSPPPISSSYYPSAPHMLLALSAGLTAPPAENNHGNHNPSIPTTPGSAVASGSNPNGKKRFRTKFTQDQKEKMHEIAERVGWKMQKRDEELINGFCNQIGVDRSVFKVWMHNNKTTFGKPKDFTNNNGNNSSGEGIDFIISRNNHHHDTGNNHHLDTGNNHHLDSGNTRHDIDHHLHLHNNGSFSTGGNVICTKGSSSSS
ncbi:unnamed protein product [Lactuca saligna]|uniref:ZF-HD dimerization-type domain-containing protein n=1 Tax=Lactuca saligna TaxID=75948 RepID=A0AA35YNE2_LACSI|nr:unnamed protein product [Lactuca saligna]